MSQTLALVGGIMLFDLIAWSPILLSAAIRRLFTVWPTERLGLNYLIGAGGYAVVHLAVLLTVVVLSGGLDGTAVFWGLGLVGLGTATMAWAIACIGFPRLGWWDPTDGDGMDGRIALGLGVIWYLGSTGITLFVVLVVVIALFLPT